jgi:hypothetical protein
MTSSARAFFCSTDMPRGSRSLAANLPIATMQKRQRQMTNDARVARVVGIGLQGCKEAFTANQKD